MIKFPILLFVLTAYYSLATAEVPSSCKQLIVGITTDSASSHVSLYHYKKQGSGWKQVGAPWPGRLGRNGCAWGLGVHNAQTGVQKHEGDGKSPSGIFKIGGAYGYASTIKRHSSLPYKKVTPSDLWVEDSTSKMYNRHILLDHPPKSSWEKKQQMRQGDYAHALKLYIAHNHASPSNPALTNRGSAIFFHIWRSNGAKATSGCTTMKSSQLEELIASIDPTADPHYILLSTKDYKRLRVSWKLP